MVKPGALLLLLAVAASQIDLTKAEVTSLGPCRIWFYGQEFFKAEVELPKDSSFTLCFFYDPSTPTSDCLSFKDAGGAGSAIIQMVLETTSTGSPLHDALPDITGDSRCHHIITLSGNGGPMMKIYVYNFGTKAAVKVEAFVGYAPANVTVVAMATNSTMESWSFTNAQLTAGVYMDITGCRDRLLPDDVVARAVGYLEIYPDFCNFSSCDGSSYLTTGSTCSDWGVCQGNNTCVLPTVVCTVTGSTVIDFFNRPHVIPDRCAYDLVKPLGGEFSLTAVFQERRRKDVPFLDKLIINLTNSAVTVDLEQGGRVLVDGVLLTLNATPQLVVGMEFSKDETGVTVTLPDSGMIVSFDGNTAHVSGPIEALESLCGSTSDPTMTTTPFNEMSPHSDDGCATLHDDIVDSTVNCTRAAEYCDLMGQAPFTACHEHIDPEPYITACINTSCTYPNVDGLICQYLEAYAESCYLRNHITLEDWRSAAGCAAVVQDSCQDQYCSYHEFCGEKLDEPRCLCRALFADVYKANHRLGEPTVCSQNSASVTLAACLLWDKGIDYSSLHLNDPDCIGDMDYDTHMVTFSFHSSTCGTVVMMNNSNVLFKNTIMTRNTSLHSSITRDVDVEIDFSCFHTQPDIRTMDFHISDNSVVQHIESGAWNYTMTFKAHSDPTRMHPLELGSPTLLNQRLWLELTAGGLDDNMVAVVTDSCWATNQPLPDEGVRHDLIVDGCPSPDDLTVDVEDNGLGTSDHFSFQMFEFYGESSDVYLHCQVELCPKGPSCAPDCSGGGLRKRRSTRSEYADGNPALITMAWKK